MLFSGQVCRHIQIDLDHVAWNASVSPRQSSVANSESTVLEVVELHPENKAFIETTAQLSSAQEMTYQH